MVIQSKNVYVNEKFQPMQVRIEQGKIVDVYPYNMLPVDKDYGELRVIPGMTDVHAHGYQLCDASHATREWLEKWVQALPKEGVTSVLAAISTAKKDDLLEGLKNIGEYIENPIRGTEILGVYEEGPFISKIHNGAQRVEYQIIPDKAVIDEFNDACKGHLIYVMVAPEELKGDYSVLDYCVSKGMKLAIGHSGATYEICEEAIAHGVTSFTHTYNGMTGLHHRKPGVVGAAMAHDDCYAELICDGAHVHKAACNILAKVKGKDKLIMVTDAVALKGLAIGTYNINGQMRTICEDGIGRLENGTIAGSCHRLNEILKFAIEDAKIDVTTAVNAVTINPCRMLGVSDRGIIKSGYRADLVVLDEQYEPVEVYIGGEVF